MSRAIRVGTVLICVAFFVCTPQPQKGTLDDLVRAASSSRRRIEMRLSGGFEWAPFVASSVSETPAVLAVAGSIIQDSASPEATGVAQLLVGKANAAVESFEKGVQATPANARLWSDLAAARCLLALRMEKPADLPRALAAVDRALMLSPDLPEAHFNRAIILEKMGLRSWAAVAWAKYLARDRDSPWASEAHARFAALRRHPPPFENRLQAALSVARSGDLRSLENAVRADPHYARLYAYGAILEPWLKAKKDGLSDARRFASAIASVSGDYFLSDYVASIESGSSSRDAVQAYFDGRAAYKQLRARDAEPLFRQAAALGRGTPLENVALYYVASAAFDQDRVEESDALLKSVQARIDGQRYPALMGEIERQLGRSDAYRGRWSECLAHFAQARATFVQLREDQMVSFIDATVAEAYDHIGMVNEFWHYRLAACDVLSRGGAIGAERLYAVVAGGVRAEIFRREYDSALSLSTLLVERLQNGAQPEVLAEALILRARVLQATGQERRAADDIRSAKHAAMNIPNPKTSARALNRAKIIEALNQSRSQPAAAAALLSDVLAVYEAAHETMWIPPLYLERGRIYRAVGRDADALNDYNAAIAEVERQRSTVSADDLRSSFFDTEPELISEAAGLLLQKSKQDEAFDVIERARGRTLIEQLAVSPPPAAKAAAIRQALQAGDLLILYEVMPDGVVLFALDRRSFTVHRVTVPLEQLRRQIEHLCDLIVANADVHSIRRESAAIRQILIAPIENRIADARHLIIVPDRFLYEVPYAALYDGHYLIEKHDITIAPSASLTLRRGYEVRYEPALIVGDPDGSLPAARVEASRVAALYPHATLLTGPQATVDAFSRFANSAALVHYAGHARASAAIAGVMPFNTGDLTAAEIARHSLKRHPVVVLAACSTLRGNTAHVEGMPSLARAFLSAGAQTVVGTLWNIPDESSDRLFNRFHRHLRQERNVARALAVTQRECITSGDARSRVSFWAAIELFGG